MSKLAELLESREKLGPPANPANTAKLQPDNRNFRNFRKAPSQISEFTPDLERRIKAMARRWEYSSGELQDVLERARVNPAGWISAVAYDEEREAEFRSLGLMAVTST